MEKPLISIIIPVYNAAKDLRQCLDSVIHQTLRQIEIICVDDGSRDESPSILQEYASEDSRIRVITQKNAGAGAARNAGMRYARGEYLSFLDADDFFEPGMMGTAYLSLEESQADFILLGSDQYIEEEDRFRRIGYAVNHRILPPYQPFSWRSMSGNVFLSMMGWAWDKVYRRSFVEKHQFLFQEQRTSNDLRFVFSALVMARKITYDDTIWIHQRRQSAGTLSTTRERSWYCFYDALISLRDFLKEQGIYEELERSFINYALHFSLWNLNTLRGDAYRKVYWRLQKEWFDSLEIPGHPEEYFDNHQEYEQYREISERTFRDYPIKLSVIIPVHNAEKYLRSCLDSVLANDREAGTMVKGINPVPESSRIALEVLCVDDASTDRTPKILQEYEKKYKNVIVLTNRMNLYAGASRNRGLQEARGRYVHFLDADDLVLPGAYRRLYDLAVEGRLDFVKTTAEALDSVSEEPVENKRYSMKELDPGYDGTLLDFHHAPRKFLACMSLVPWNALYRREFLLGEKIEFNHLYCVNDRSFFVETCMKAKRMTTARFALVRHRVNVGGSLVAGRAAHFDCQFASYRLMKKLCEEQNVSERVRFCVLDAELYDLFMWYTKMDLKDQEKWSQPMARFFAAEVDVEWFRRSQRSQWLALYDRMEGGTAG